MLLLLFLVVLLVPVSSFAQTLWPVPQRDGTIVYVPMGNGTPPLWSTPDGRGGLNYVPHYVPPPRMESVPRYTLPPLTAPDFQAIRRSDPIDDANRAFFELSR